VIGGSPWTRRALAAVGILGLIFLAVPILIVIPMSFSSAKALTFPPPSFSLRWYETFFGDPRWMDAMWISTLVALVSSVLRIGVSSLLGAPTFAHECTRRLSAVALAKANLHAH